MAQDSEQYNAPIRPGSQLGRFEILRALGKGGMGAVFLARDTLLDVPVALKVLNPSLAEGEGLERFRREVLLARRVTHPGVCRLFDMHSDSGVFYLSMEYIEGPTLQQVLREVGLLPPALAVSMLRAACLAMAAAHGHDVVHRDLKPGNMIVRGAARVAILDFGLSKARDTRNITAAGYQVGTVHYMSPEVVRGEEADKRSDIYSLGVMLYECLTGRLPFEGNNILDLQLNIVDGRAVPPRQFVPGLPANLEQIIQQAMQRDPAQRFTTCDALERALSSQDLGSPEQAWASLGHSTILAKLPGEETSVVSSSPDLGADPEEARATEAPSAPPPSVAAAVASTRSSTAVDPEEKRSTLASSELAIPVQRSGSSTLRSRAETLPSVDEDEDPEATRPTLIESGVFADPAGTLTQPDRTRPQLPGFAPPASASPQPVLPAAAGPPSQTTERVLRPGVRLPEAASNRKWFVASAALIVSVGVTLGLVLGDGGGTPAPVEAPTVVAEDPAMIAERPLPGPTPSTNQPSLPQRPEITPEPNPDSPPRDSTAPTKHGQTPAPPRPLRGSPDPGHQRPPKPEPTTPPVSDLAPPLVPVSDAPPLAIDDVQSKAASRRDRIQDVQRTVREALHSRSIRRGDDIALDGALRELDAAIGADNLDAVAQAGDRALRALKAVAINKRFVDAKLDRYNTRIGNRLEGWPNALSGAIMEAMDAQNYEKANRLLSKGMQNLDEGR
ncbi:MAG: protein kinase [Pseudomonadota bacterium]